MPSRKSSKIPPAASRRKRMLHAIYMAQPLLQFAALMAVLFVLGRCSPLSPSTEKGALKKTSDNGVIATPSENGQNQAIEEDIKRSLKPLNETEDTAVVSEKAFAESARESLHADRPADADRVRFLFAQRRAKVLVLPLSAEERLALSQGSVRIDLAKRLAASMNPEVKRVYFALLVKNLRRLQAKAVLILPTKDMEREGAVDTIPLRTKFELGILADDKAYLQGTKIDADLDPAQQELISSNLKLATGLAVVLE